MKGIFACLEAHQLPQGRRMKYPPLPDRLNCLHKWNQIQVSGLSSQALLQCCSKEGGCRDVLARAPELARLQETFRHRVFHLGHFWVTQRGFPREGWVSAETTLHTALSKAQLCSATHVLAALGTLYAVSILTHRLSHMSWSGHPGE